MDLRAILAGLAFAFIWSSAFTSARIIVSEAPPLLSLSLRFFLSGLIGVAIARALGQSWRLTRGQWASVVVFGLCQNALYLGLNFVAMQSIEASLAAIIASTMPLLVAFALFMFFGERGSPMAYLGLVVGVIGVVLIMGTRVQAGSDVFGIFLCLIGVVSLTIATLVMRGASSGGNLMMVVGLQMFVGAALLAVPGALLETWDVTWSTRLTLAFTYTIVFPGLVATLIWFWLVQRIGATKAATFHFLNPVFGVSVAAILLGESMGILDGVGVLVITLGILAVQLSRSQATR